MQFCLINASWMPPVCLSKVAHLALCDDVEGAAFLALPDDVLSFIIVLLVARREARGRQRTVIQNCSTTLIPTSTRMVWFLVAGPLRDEGESLVVNNAPYISNFQLGAKQGIALSVQLIFSYLFREEVLWGKMRLDLRFNARMIYSLSNPRNSLVCWDNMWKRFEMVSQMAK